MNSFDGIIIEDIKGCSPEYDNSGLRARLHYAPASFFSTIDLPLTSPNFSENAIINNQSIIFQSPDCGWAYIDVLIDANEVGEEYSGGNRRLKVQTSLSIHIPKLTPQIMGMVRLFKNTPMIYCVTTTGGQDLLIGNLLNRAFFSTIKITTAKTYEEMAGINATITCNAPLLFLSDSITSTPSSPGTGINPNQPGDYLEEEFNLTDTMISAGVVNIILSEIIDKNKPYSLFYNGVYVPKSAVSFGVANNIIIDLTMSDYFIPPIVGDNVIVKYYKL